MGGKKKVLLALFVLIVLLGGFLVARGYPDWALNVMQREGTTFVVTGSVDANITNTEINAYVTNTTITIEPSDGAEFIIKPAAAAVFNIQGQVDANITNTELDVYVTNSTITIEPSSTAEFIIKPAEAVVFNVQGQVDANITNTELDVNVTNSTITITPEAEAVFEVKPSAGVTFNIEGDVNATIQGTASVSIDNATVTIDTATIRENVETEGKVKTKWGSQTITSGSFAQLLAYTNTETYDVYLESVGAVGYMDSSPYNPMYLGYGIIVVEVFDASSTLAFDLTYDIAQLPHNFDPAIRIPPNWEIRVYAYNYSPDTRRFEGWILLSYR